MDPNLKATYARLAPTLEAEARQNLAEADQAAVRAVQNLGNVGARNTVERPAVPATTTTSSAEVKEPDGSHDWEAEPDDWDIPGISR